MKSTDAIPGLIICNSGYITRLTLPEDEYEELMATGKVSAKQTTTRKPELITLDAGYITRVGDKVIEI